MMSRTTLGCHCCSPIIQGRSSPRDIPALLALPRPQLHHPAAATYRRGYRSIFNHCWWRRSGHSQRTAVAVGGKGKHSSTSHVYQLAHWTGRTASPSAAVSSASLEVEREATCDAAGKGNYSPLGNLCSG